MRMSDCSSDVCSSDLCHSVSSRRRLLSSLRILPLLSRLGREVARLKLVILVPPVVVRLSGEAPTLSARMTRFCIIEVPCFGAQGIIPSRSEEHTSELQSLMRISYAVFCLKKKKKYTLRIKYNR